MPSIKPMNKDILLEFEHKRDVIGTSLFIPDDNAELQYYRVSAVGPNVRGVSPGDLVVVQWKNITMPFVHEGVKYGITDDKMVLGVIEED